MYGFSPRHSAYLLSLELSEMLGHHLLGKSAAAEHLLDEEWSLVGRLDRFQDNKSTRHLPAIRKLVESVRAATKAAGIPPNVAEMARAKLDALSAELDLIAGEPGAVPCA